ncbi:MAG TPA: sensor histidine kinase [Caulobacteraceae bacterium]|nr:sensor histidine kinase [Caulobacteraceae bacterium]
MRLGLALALALLPVLFLSAVQAGLAFQRQAQLERTELTAAAERSGAVARARIDSAQVLLQTLAPGSIGFQCAQRLSEIGARLKGYENLIRFDANGRFACAAADVPPDPARGSRPWFSALRAGAPLVIASNPGAVYAREPSLVAAVRAEDPQGRFDGALAAVMSLASLRPDISDRALPAGSEIALADNAGHWLSATNLARFPIAPGARFGAQSRLWAQVDRTGVGRIFAAAPLVGQEVYVVISAPRQGLVSWAWLNPVSAIALPILAFALALIAVWTVAERGVVRWIAYLQRIAAIYARGRFSVRPVQAERAPPEIRDLADTLGAMAATIVARDAMLLDHIAQKDAMLLEIHHRVKNNLQIISSLLNMQQRALTDPSARAAISDTRQRITALALIYRALYQSPDLRRVDLREFLEELVGQLITGEAGQRLARTDFSCDPVVIDPDRLAPIALFAVEAISNACKHGLAVGGQLSIAFRVRRGEGELSITDTGFEGRTSKLGAGVGRTLMSAYARQLRGEASFKANPGGGLVAKVTFPIPESAAAGAPSAASDTAPPRALSPAAAR